MSKPNTIGLGEYKDEDLLAELAERGVTPPLLSRDQHRQMRSAFRVLHRRAERQQSITPRQVRMAEDSAVQIMQYALQADKITVGELIEAAQTAKPEPNLNPATHDPITTGQINEMRAGMSLPPQNGAF